MAMGNGPGAKPCWPCAVSCQLSAATYQPFRVALLPPCVNWLTTA